MPLDLGAQWASCHRTDLPSIGAGTATSPRFEPHRGSGVKQQPRCRPSESGIGPSLSATTTAGFSLVADGALSIRLPRSASSSRAHGTPTGVEHSPETRRADDSFDIGR